MKLINRYTSTYLAYTALILLIAVPILYFSVQLLVARKMDQNLSHQKDMILNSLNSIGQENLMHTVFLEPGIRFSPAVQKAQESERFTLEYRFDSTDHDFEPFRVLQTTIFIKGKPYLLELSSSLLDKEELIYGIVILVFLFLFIITAGLYAINRTLFTRVWQPFYRTVAALNTYKIEQDEVLYFEKTTVTEFTNLQNAIHSLTRRNAEVFQSQKSFIENVSHEMQTPVSVQLAKLELLLQTEPLSRAQFELIAGVLDITERTGRLHDSLLLLARIDNRQFGGTEFFSVKAVIEQLVDRCVSQAEFEKITFSLQLTKDIQVNANKFLFEIMIGNLVNNSIRHNVPGGSVTISCDGNIVAIANTGKTQVLDNSKLFQRFISNPTVDGSVGLGLHIAKRIAVACNMVLTYDYLNGQHVFELRT